LECLGCRSWMPWESSGISEIAWVTNVRFVSSLHGLMIRLADQSDRYVCYTYSALRYDLMGITLRRGFPCVWTPTIRFRMAVDAIAFRILSTRLPVRYYLANLGTTMESQVRSSVHPSTLSILSIPSYLSLCQTVCLPGRSRL